MDTKRTVGKTDVGSLHVLPSQPFDSSENQSLSAKQATMDVPVTILPDMAFDLQSPFVSPLTIQDLALACRLFMHAAYPDGIDTVPASKRPYYHMDDSRPIEDFLLPASVAVGVCQDLSQQKKGPQGYEFRLGSARYPHIKLRIEVMEFRKRNIWVYSVNTHDGFQQVTKYLSAAEAEAWRCLVEHNRDLKQQIENAFVAAKLFTHTQILKLGLTAEGELV